MRWKLLVLVSVVAAIAACGIWSGIAVATFGSARALARHDRLLLASALVPLAVAGVAAFFVYRHTSRRRKTQALVTLLFALLLTVGVYLMASQIFPERLTIPRTYEVRIAR